MSSCGLRSISNLSSGVCEQTHTRPLALERCEPCKQDSPRHAHAGLGDCPKAALSTCAACSRPCAPQGTVGDLAHVLVEQLLGRMPEDVCQVPVRAGPVVPSQLSRLQVSEPQQATERQRQLDQCPSFTMQGRRGRMKSSQVPQLWAHPTVLRFGEQHETCLHPSLKWGVGGVQTPQGVTAQLHMCQGVSLRIRRPGL